MPFLIVSVYVFMYVCINSIITHTHTHTYQIYEVFNIIYVYINFETLYNDLGTLLTIKKM